MADPEDDSVGNEFLRVKVSLDITKPLPHCRKLGQKVIRLVGLD